LSRVDPRAANALDALDVLVGTWTVQASVEDSPAGVATIAWELNRRCIVWRVSIPAPEFPDSLSLVTGHGDGKTYLQHYFDDRGTARLYTMTLEAGRWTLLRDAADFTPLEFAQRFSATIAPDGQTIAGAWESSGSDGRWRRDFDLVYRKAS
jgi:hypothetical protein